MKIKGQELNVGDTVFYLPNCRYGFPVDVTIGDIESHEDGETWILLCWDCGIEKWVRYGASFGKYVFIAHEDAERAFVEYHLSLDKGDTK